ncbi:MAG: 16S rRNA (adenine(1518)-N(6)/adenine(1519)-N(6))-dimethyltransferase RsmA [Gluconacetobacter diazotrophicus]|nr:16S rRNA (adenine(1518)-N(6)/adenine(1519)-N(6))-dimethyltransferase RsmA [Gluconacetobacter diazotrophicus]
MPDEAGRTPLPVLPSLGSVIAAHGLDARKSLGQHFLLDPALLARIAALAGDLHGREVVEVGPGPGGLTRAILGAGAGRLLAVEIDARAVAAIEALRDLLVANGDQRLSVLPADAAGLDLAKLVEAPRQIIANLPYNIGTPLLVGWLRQAGLWERLTLMFQLEVAERIVAAPDTDHYGRLAVLANWCCETAITARIPPGAFSPPPRVHSAVVSLVPRSPQPDAALFTAMERLTAAAFGQRRKMLRGSLRALGGAALLEHAGIDPGRRAETLSIAEFERLARLTIGDRPAA